MSEFYSQNDFNDPQWHEKQREFLENLQWKCRNCGNSGEEFHIYHSCNYKYDADGKLAKKLWEYPDSSMFAICNTCYTEELHKTAYHEVGHILQHLISCSQIVPPRSPHIQSIRIIRETAGGEFAYDTHRIYYEGRYREAVGGTTIPDGYRICHENTFVSTYYPHKRQKTLDILKWTVREDIKSCLAGVAVEVSKLYPSSASIDEFKKDLQLERDRVIVNAYFQRITGDESFDIIQDKNNALLDELLEDVIRECNNDNWIDDLFNILVTEKKIEGEKEVNEILKDIIEEVSDTFSSSDYSCSSTHEFNLLWDKYHDSIDSRFGKNNPGYSPVCFDCKHLNRNISHPILWACKAFPKEGEIPNEIWNGENDHTQPYHGDNGIMFERREVKNRSRKKCSTISSEN